MKTRIALVVLAVLAVPCAAAAGVPDDAPTAATAVAAAAPSADVAPAAPAAPASSAAAPAPVAPLEPLFLADGCTAEQICVHQPPATVSCSGPPGTTCSSSWGGCGRVTCNGVTTRCPGYCVGDHHCFNFCMNTYGSFDGFCNTGCCECL
jgi:hypothetical protein